LVSVIVNSFNYARYVGAALDSALAQDHPEVEVLVVDDGSTDGSRDVIAGYGERVRAILKENGGQASALNAGFAACRGDIVIFVDSDDLLYPHAASGVAGAWANGCAKVQYRLAVIDADGRPTGGTFPAARVPLPDGDLVGMIAATGGYPSPVTSGNAYARDVLEALMPIPEPEFRLSADGYLNPLVPFYGPVVSIQEPLGAYRLHGENRWLGLTSRDDLRRHVEHDLLKERYVLATARSRGRPMPADLALRDAGHVLHRLGHLRVDPASHPCPGDTRLGLARAGVRAIRASPELAGAERVAYALLLVAIAAAPRRLAERLLAQALASRPRPAALRLLRRALRRLRLPRRRTDARPS
jgi:hypothetical protein